MSDRGGAASGVRHALVVVDVQNDFLPPHGALAVPGGHAVIDKGTAQGSDGYSAFESTQLSELLRDRQVELLTITGLATDVCVKHTALDALQRGLRVRIPTAAVRGIDVSGNEQALAELAVAGAQVI